MPTSSDFMLERFVHHLLQGGSSSEPRALLEHASRHGMDAFRLFKEIVWPAAECAQQLRRAGVVSPQVFNHATHLLTSLTAGLFPSPDIAKNMMKRELLIVSAPREPSDNGAQLLAALAEARGFTAHFAGARLTIDDICFAVARLHVDAIVIHGSLRESAPAIAHLFEALHHRAVWPDVQLAVTGAALGDGQALEGADLWAACPDEVLELLALCPDHRTKKAVPPPSLPIRPEPVSEADLLFAYFPPRSRRF